MSDDSQLLRRFSEEHSEEAFAALVREHLNLVYSAALRKTGGNSALAADVSQQVFAALAARARALADHPTLAGWLYTTTHFTAAKLVRAECRRQARERDAQAMQDLLSSSEPEPRWEQLRPVLDDAMHALAGRDRDAVLLRYFENRPFAEVGARLGLGENAARMRVERALAKLRSLLARRGITSTEAALVLLLAEHGVTAAPAGLAASISGAALATGTGSGLAAIWTLMSTSKITAGVLGLGVLAVGAGLTVQQNSLAALRAENTALAERSADLPALRAAHQNLVQSHAFTAEPDPLRQDRAELARLRGEVASLESRTLDAIRIRTQPKRTAANGKPTLDVGQLDVLPKPNFQSPPVYPIAMAYEGSVGEVTVRFVVDTEGNVADAIAVSSSDPAFEDCSVEAVRKWRFTPGMKGGATVNTQMSVPILYTFREDPPAKH
jgi:RNA polymerase sigma factor (sigma-70 family)